MEVKKSFHGAATPASESRQPRLAAYVKNIAGLEHPLEAIQEK
jgi:hypothetical protein